MRVYSWTEYAIPIDSSNTLAVSDEPCPFCGGHVWVCWYLEHYRGGWRPDWSAGSLFDSLIDGIQTHLPTVYLDECLRCGATCCGETE